MRMFRELLVLLLLVSVPRAAFAADITAESRISKVVVYPGAAFITRTAHLKIDAGRHKVIFPKIIPEVYEESLRVSSGGLSGVRLYGAEVSREFLIDLPSAKVQELKDKIQALEDRKKRISNEKEALNQRRKFLDSVQLFSGSQIPKDLVTIMPAAETLEKTLNFIDVGFKDFYSGVEKADADIRELNKNIEALNNELGQVSGSGQKVQRSIIVEIESDKAGEVDLELAYLVNGASWTGLYDARVNFEKSEIELVSYGVVKQVTGEDWNDIELWVSTARLTISGNMPEITPWFLRPAEPLFSKRQMMRKADMAMDAMQSYALEEKAAAPKEEYAKAEEKGVAVIYKLPRAVSVKSGAAEQKLAISAQVLKAEFKYSAYPKESLYSYLGSKVTNSAGLQLLAGAVNVFLDGDFTGKSRIDNVGAGEKFDLYLGVDENVKVKRELIEKKVDETLIGNIPGVNKKIVYKYKLTAENYKSKKAKINLFEAIPVSTDDRIKVKVLQVSKEAQVKDWEDKKGIWLWELEVEPGAKLELSYTYEVEYPRKMPVEGI